jgi:hypothetical protein
MSDGIIVSQHALTDSVEALRKLRDQLEANLSSLSHVSLDSGARRLIAEIHRSLLAMAENSTEVKSALGVFNGLRVVGMISDPRLTMDPEMLLHDLDALIELVNHLATSRARPTPTTLPASPAAPVAASAAAPAAAPTKRGRKILIPDQRKFEALAAKMAGKSNKAVAIILYDESYPSAQQVKNVSAILRHFKKSRAYAESLTTTVS